MLVGKARNNRVARERIVINVLGSRFLNWIFSRHDKYGGDRKYYCEEFRDSILVELKDRFVKKAKNAQMVEFPSRYRVSWYVFDRDSVKDFGERF